jgi:hypothetical protein
MLELISSPSPPPPGLITSLGRTAQASIIAEVRQALDRHYSSDHADASGRVGAHIENGLLLLFQWMEQGALRGIDLEQCRTLAAAEPRLSFVYNLPNSAGFGAAIGTALDRALFGNELAETRELTALLQVFMTVLDGLLDETPQLMAHCRIPLLAVIADPEISVPEEHTHPFVTLCFEVARKWSRAAHDSPQPHFRSVFFSTVCESMTAEYLAGETTLGTGSPPNEEALYGRTRWPHWTQALVCLLHRKPAQDFDVTLYRDLIFRIGDYVAFLDDIHDYVDDFEAGRWNTVTSALYRQQPFAAGEEWRLLVRLGEDRVTKWAVRTTLEMRGAISDAIGRAGLPGKEILALVGDMSHVSLL